MGDIKRQYRNDAKQPPAAPQGSNPRAGDKNMPGSGKPSPTRLPAPREKG